MTHKRLAEAIVVVACSFLGIITCLMAPGCGAVWPEGDMDADRYPDLLPTTPTILLPTFEQCVYINAQDHIRCRAECDGPMCFPSCRDRFKARLEACKSLPDAPQGGGQ